MTIGEKLKKLRLNRHLKQINLANIAKITPQAYSQYELNKRQPSVDAIINIAIFYGISADYLLGFTDDPTPYYKSKPANLKELNVAGMSEDKIDALIAVAKIFRE